jgi:hypothetical protein
LAAAARTAAQRFFVAAMILCMPSSLIWRFAFGGATLEDWAATPFCLLAVAHRFRCASAIRFLPAALTFRRVG